MVGADEEGEHLRRLLVERGVEADLVVEPDLPTPWLQRIRAAGQLVTRLDRRSTTRAAKRPALYRRLRPTAVTPNWSETLGLLGPVPLDGAPASERGDRTDVVAIHGERALDATRAQIAAVTLDRDGALVVEPGRPPYRTFTTPVDDGQAAGAGDTFLAAFALALGAGAEDLEAQLLGGTKVVRDEAELEPLAERLRGADRRTVFTNGCFDLLHRGHVTYLNRTQVLGALSCADYVKPFDAPTPDRLLRGPRPERYVKGGDYSRETLPEANLLAELGTRVDILPLVEDRSTTGLIDRIRDVSPVG